MSTATLILHLSNPPPSANSIWRTYKGRTVKSAEYTSWLVSSGWEVKKQARGFKLPDPSYWSTILYVPRSKTRVDLDNIAKPTHDLLKTLGIVPDDRFLVSSMQVYSADDTFRIEIFGVNLDTWLPIMNPSPELKKRLISANKEG